MKSGISQAQAAKNPNNALSNPNRARLFCSSIDVFFRNRLTQKHFAGYSPRDDHASGILHFGDCWVALFALACGDANELPWSDGPDHDVLNDDGLDYDGLPSRRAHGSFHIAAL